MSFRFSRVAILALTLAAPVWAGDLCLDNSQGGTPSLDDPIIIARNFKLPGKDKCKLFTGVLAGVTSVVTGSACTSFNGDHVALLITAARPALPAAPSTGDDRTYRGYLTIATMEGSL